jgi:hypothetical protein
MIYFGLCLLAFISAVCYRMGGSDTYNTKWRDFGCPLCVLIGMLLVNQWHWSLLLCFPLMFGAMTTYWKVLNKFFKKSTEDSYWFNWLAHGLMIGLALFPLTFFVGLLVEVLARSIFLGLLMMIWSEIIDDAVYEEMGRGALIILTLTLFL